MTHDISLNDSMDTMFLGYYGIGRPLSGRDL